MSSAAPPGDGEEMSADEFTRQLQANRKALAFPKLERWLLEQSKTRFLQAVDLPDSELPRPYDDDTLIAWLADRGLAITYRVGAYTSYDYSGSDTEYMWVRQVFLEPTTRERALLVSRTNMQRSLKYPTSTNKMMDIREDTE